MDAGEPRRTQTAKGSEDQVVILGVTIAVTSAVTKNNLERKGLVSAYSFLSWAITEGTQGRSGCRDYGGALAYHGLLSARAHSSIGPGVTLHIAGPSHLKHLSRKCPQGLPTGCLVETLSNSSSLSPS